MRDRNRQAGQPGAAPTRQSHLYEAVVKSFGGAIEWLARSYELDAHKCQDLLQNIHLNLWRSLERFEGQCSPRTWVYRVAHNVAATPVLDERRRRSQPLVGLDDLDDVGIEPGRRVRAIRFSIDRTTAPSLAAARACLAPCGTNRTPSHGFS